MIWIQSREMETFGTPPQNIIVWLVFSARKYDHTTPLLRELHWLKVPERVKFRLCVLTYRCLNGTAPHYLAETIHPITIAVAPDSVYDLPTRQLYLCHPHAAQLLAIAHFRLPHEHGTLYHNRFRTRLLFLSSDGN